MQAPDAPESSSIVFSTLQNPPATAVSASLTLETPSALPLCSVLSAPAAATQTEQEEATSAHPMNTMLSLPVCNTSLALSPSSPSTPPVNGSLRFEAVQELQPPPSAASSAAPAPSDSAKSLAPPSASAPQPKCQNQPKPTNGRDNTFKRDISSSSRLLESEQGAKSLASSRHTPPSASPPPISSPSYLHPIGGEGDGVGDSVAAAPAASAAAASLPPRSTCSSSSSCGPIPMLLSPADSAMQSGDGDRHAVNNNNNNMLHLPSSLSGPASSASASTSTSAPLLSASARLSASLLLLFNNRHTAATSTTSTLPPSSSCCVDISCHCLVVDDSRLAKDSPAERQYQQALQLGQPSDAQALLQHVRGWLSAQHALDASSIAVAYAPARQPRRLHVNFSSLPGLAAALLACPFLVRCGSLLSGSAWGGAAPCGDVKRHQLPELIQLSCIPSASSSGTLSQLLNTDAAALLREMQLEYTTWWPASSMTTHGRGNANNSNEPPARIVLLVLPRSILTLSADIERLHGRHSLWGGKVRVQGVNQPSLRRCTQCDEIGHDSSKCAKYSGLALRLLFKQPLPFAAMLSIQQSAQAKLAFLGSSVDEMQPSRRLTLLFDAQAEDTTRMEEILSRLAPVISDLGSALQQPPDVVNVQHRHRECRECGWMPLAGQSASSHVCPFSMQHGPTPFRSQRPAASVTAPAAAPQQSSSRDRASDARACSASSDSTGVCRSWRRNKTCPRLDKQQRCEFLHPEQQEQTNVCFEWQRTGRCSRGLVCRFGQSHNNPPAVQEESAAAAAPAQAAATAAPSVAISPPSSNEQQESKEESEARDMDIEAAAQTAQAPASPPSSARSAAALPVPSPSKKRGRGSKEAQAAEIATEETSSGDAAASADAASSSEQASAASSSALSSSSWAQMHFDASEEEQDDCLRRETIALANRRKAASRNAAAPISSLSSLSLSFPSRSKGTASTTAAAAEAASPAKKARGSSLSRSSSDAATAASSAASASVAGSSRSSSSSSQRSSHRGR